MRSGVGDNPEWQAELAKGGITTGIMARLDFESGSEFIWTGAYPLAVNGTGDPLCDGKTFDPLAQGVLVDVGANAFSYSGSEALPITLAIPDPATPEMIASANDPTEWQGRMCVLWRVVMQKLATADAPMQYVVKRVRAGAMDELRITNDGQKHIFTLTIEAHASMTSNATGGTYLDQKKLVDPNDTSQDYAVAAANNPRAPGRSTNWSGGYSGGGGGGRTFFGIVGDIYREQER